MSKQHKLSVLAELVNGSLDGDPDYSISSLSSITRAGPGDLSFLDAPKLAAALDTTEAGCVIVST